jgi:hypothetical protein
MKKIVITRQDLEEINRRFAAICPLLEFKHRLNRGGKVLFRDCENIFHTMEDLSVHIAQISHISHATIWHWYSKFQRDGFHGLHICERSDKGYPRFFMNHIRSAALVKVLSRGGLSAQSIHNQLISSGEEAPSYDTTRTFVRLLRASSNS